MEEDMIDDDMIDDDLLDDGADGDSSPETAKHNKSKVRQDTNESDAP